MKAIRFMLKLLARLFKILLYGWILSLISIIRQVIDRIKDFFKNRKHDEDTNDETDLKCATINHPSFHRPDPLIYSQPYLQSLGIAVTWDNPDIVIRKNGVIVPEHTLLPATEYEVDATVWNNSFDAPAVGMHVSFAYLSFGVSTVINPIGNTVINLGVKGGLNHPAVAKIPWITPATPGHYCLKVDLQCIDDFNTANNTGYNNTDVVAAHSPAVFGFQLRNDTEKPHRYTFQVDTYTIPPQPDCGDVILTAAAKTAVSSSRTLAVHTMNNFLIPAGWTVMLSPDEVSLLANEETTIQVSITPPNGFTGSQNFNVNAYRETTLAGGVTLVVTKQ